MTAITTTSVVDNGVNVEALLGAQEAFADAPDIARFQGRSTVTWIHGSHSCAGVDAFSGFGAEQRHRTTFAFDIDHPCSSPRRTTGSRRWSTCFDVLNSPVAVMVTVS